jgi:large subunit ribosomal protein L18
MLTHRDKNIRRAQRVRYKIKKTQVERPRLSVFRSNDNIYAQIIDDSKRLTLVSASTVDVDLKKASLKSGANIEAARAVGSLVAKRAKEKGISKVVFDRGAYLYHGRVKALAEAARETGLEF